MSLAEQSQQWYPTSVQVTVLQARGLRVKGKNGTNDAYAIMQVAKDKFSTSVAEKSVAPVWKEEASFDLPLFNPSNAERCALQVSVMHRALVGPDKMLGLAIVKLLELYDNKSRNKSEWFKLMGKTGKPDKDRGEVLIDIQFMKNNMTASMFDLSGMDKSRSRLGKLKDKLKGKKKDGMSDSASAIVPSVGQILTDSEGEEADVTHETKKKSKLKSLFAPKGLHRNISQSMSTLPTLPEKDSAISLSRSSGLNVESPEGKKKFKLFKHKRTDSSDSKVSQGAGSSLGQGMSQNSLCINGSHVYTEDPETRGSRTGSTLSLNSSGHGSMEDLRRGANKKISTTSADLQTQESLAEEMLQRQEEQRKQEEMRRRLEEERRRQIEEEEREEMRMEEERKRIEREEMKRIEREGEKRRMEKMEEEKRRIEREEERKRIEREGEKRRMEQMEEKRIEREEERKRIEREGEKRRMEQMEEEERIEREEEMMRLEKLEEERRIEREEKRMRLEKLEEEKRRMEREEERKHIEREEEQRRIEEEEMQRKEEMARIKREQEEERKEEEERIRAEERMREVEEKRIREERRRMEEEEKARLEKEEMKKEEEDKRRIEAENKRAEEEERLRKEKMSAEERARRMIEEKERKERERLQLEKEKLELEKKEKEEKEKKEKLRMEERMKAEEEEKRQLKADQERIKQEKDEMEKKKKEQMDAIETRPEVKPRSARMNAAKKAEKADTIGLEYTPPTNPFEDSLLLDENSTYPFEQSSESLSRSSKVSAVKPSSSVSGNFFSQASLANTNPFLDDSDVDSGNIDNVSLGDWSERSEKKRRAPLPPQNKTADASSGDLPSSKMLEVTQTFLRRETNEDSGKSNVFSLHRDKRPAPSPPDVYKNNEVLNKDHVEESTTSSQEEPNLFISPGVRAAKHGKGPAPAKPSLKIKDALKENLALVPEPKNQTIHHENVTERALYSDEASDSHLDQSNKFSKQSGHNLDNLLISVEPVLKLGFRESGKEDLNLEVTKKKIQAPLPPAKLTMRDDQKSTSQLDKQDQDRTLSINSGISTSVFCSLPTLNSPSTTSQAPETVQSHMSGNKTLPQAKVSPTDAQTVPGQIHGGEPKRTGDPAIKPSRPHAVKPLSSIDNQQDFKENQDNITSAKMAEGVQVKMKAPETKRTGPYAQLTHEELVNLLEKQRDQLSQKDTKIIELEQYIDNLLVRVIEEQPSILMSLNSLKKSV